MEKANTMLIAKDEHENDRIKRSDDERGTSALLNRPLAKEIGSEFWDVPTAEKENGLFPESTQWFLSGRSALQSIIKELGGARSVSLPSWCCDSVVRPFADAGLSVRFYPVYARQELFQEISRACDVLFIMDFFGYTSAPPALTGYKGIVIRDVTHSIFSSAYTDSDYCFGSLRKWCGVWTGGYAWSKDGHQLFMEDAGDCGYTARREQAMRLKESYIHERGVADKGYLDLFAEAEEALDRIGIAPAPVRDVGLAKRIDMSFIRQRRRANAEILRTAFPEWLIFPKMLPTDCPMFVPVLVPDGQRDALRRHLIRHEIYCPIHWPVSEYHKLDERTEGLYKNSLSLVCDQRYTEKDMRRIVDVIKDFWRCDGAQGIYA